MPYKPTAEDFEEISDAPYKPTAEDFQSQESYIEPVRAPMEMELTKELKNKADWGGLADDALHMLKDSLRGIGGLIYRSPSNLKEIGSELLQHPISYPAHASQQVLTGLAEGTKELLNIPHKALGALGKHNIIPEWLKKYNELPFTHIPEDTGVEKFLGLEATNDSDELLRALPAIYGVGKPVYNKIKQVATAPSKEKLFQRALEERINHAASKTNMSKDQLAALQDALKLEYSEKHPGAIGELSSVGQKVAINEKNRQMGELADSAAKTELVEIPPAPDVHGATKALADALESKRTHHKHGGRIYQKEIEADKAASSQLYNDYRSDLKQHDIKIDNSKAIKDVTARLTEMKDKDELAPGYGIGTAEQTALETQLKSLENETVNAEDVFALKRTLDHMADETKNKQYSGVDEMEFKRLRLIVERLESKSSKLSKVLEKVGGPEVNAKLKSADRGWAQYLAAKNHPVGRKALKEALLAPDTLGKLDIIGLGSDYLKSIRDANPQLEKHIFSQKYGKESQFKHLLEPKEEVEPYLANRDDLHPHIEKLRETMHEKEKHGELVTAIKDKAKFIALEKQIEFHQNALPKIEARMKDIDVNSAEHRKLQKELDEHKKQIADKGGKLKKLGSFILKLKGIQGFGNKVGF